MKTPLLAALLLALPAAAQAHEVWVERDGTGPARIYLGEPAEPLPAGGDPEFEKLQAPKLVAAPNAKGTRKAGWIEVAHPAGDVRAWDDNVFQPWGEDGAKQSIVYYARAGRTETAAKMPLEIVPAAANGDRFLLVRDGKPVADTAITVITPDKWSKAFKTDAAGAVTVPLKEKGRYLLSANVEDTAGPHQTPAGPVATLHRTATTTFVVE